MKVIQAGIVWVKVVQKEIVWTEAVESRLRKQGGVKAEGAIQAKEDIVQVSQDHS